MRSAVALAALPIILSAIVDAYPSVNQYNDDLLERGFEYGASDSGLIQARDAHPDAYAEAEAYAEAHYYPDLGIYERDLVGQDLHELLRRDPNIFKKLKHAFSNMGKEIIHAPGNIAKTVAKDTVKLVKHPGQFGKDIFKFIKSPKNDIGLVADAVSFMPIPGVEEAGLAVKAGMMAEKAGKVTEDANKASKFSKGMDHISKASDKVDDFSSKVQDVQQVLPGNNQNHKRGLFHAAEHLMDHVTGVSDKVDQVSQTVQGVQQTIPGAGMGSQGGGGNYKRGLFSAAEHVMDHVTGMSDKVDQVSQTVQGVQQIIPGQGGMAGGGMGAQGGMSGQGGNYKRGLFSAAEHVLDHVTGLSDRVGQVTQTVQGVQQIIPGQGGMAGGGMGAQGGMGGQGGNYKRGLFSAAEHVLDHVTGLSDRVGQVTQTVQGVQQIIPGQGGMAGGGMGAQGGMGGQGGNYKRGLFSAAEHVLDHVTGLSDRVGQVTQTVQGVQQIIPGQGGMAGGGMGAQGGMGGQGGNYKRGLFSAAEHVLDHVTGLSDRVGQVTQTVQGVQQIIPGQGGMAGGGMGAQGGMGGQGGNYKRGLFSAAEHVLDHVTGLSDRVGQVTQTVQGVQQIIPGQGGMAGGGMGAQGGMGGQGQYKKRGLMHHAMHLASHHGSHLLDHTDELSSKVDQVTQTVQGVQQIIPGQGGMGGQGQYKKRGLMHHAMHLASHHGSRLLDHTDTLSQKIGDVSTSVQSVQQLLPGQGGAMGGQGQFNKRTLQAVLDYHLARRGDCSGGS